MRVYYYNHNNKVTQVQRESGFTNVLTYSTLETLDTKGIDTVRNFLEKRTRYVLTYCWNLKEGVNNMWIILTILLAITCMWLIKVNKDLVRTNEGLLNRLVDSLHDYVMLKKDIRNKEDNEWLRWSMA